MDKANIISFIFQFLIIIFNLKIDRILSAVLLYALFKAK